MILVCGGELKIYKVLFAYDGGLDEVRLKYYYDLDVKEVSASVEDGLRNFFEECEIFWMGKFSEEGYVVKENSPIYLTMDMDNSVFFMEYRK